MGCLGLQQHRSKITPKVRMSESCLPWSRYSERTDKIQLFFSLSEKHILWKMLRRNVFWHVAQLDNTCFDSPSWEPATTSNTHKHNILEGFCVYNKLEKNKKPMLEFSVITLCLSPSSLPTVFLQVVHTHSSSVTNHIKCFVFKPQNAPHCLWSDFCLGILSPMLLLVY